MPLADFPVICIMGGGNFERTGAELAVDVLIGYYRNVFVAKRLSSG